MTEQEIRKRIKNKEYVNWINISCYQSLSEDFIREYADKVYIKYIPLCYFKIKYKISWRSFI